MGRLIKYLIRKLAPGQVEDVERLRELCGYGEERPDTRGYLSERGLLVSGTSMVHTENREVVRIRHLVLTAKADDKLAGLLVRFV